MKRATLLRNLNTVIERVRDCNGVMETPMARFELARIKRLWVFGSILTDKPNPSDLDLLVDIEQDGEHRKWQEGMPRSPRMFRAYGLNCLLESTDVMLKAMRNGMRGVHFEDLQDNAYIDCPVYRQRRMLWPVCEYDPTEVLPAYRSDPAELQSWNEANGCF